MATTDTTQTVVFRTYWDCLLTKTQAAQSMLATGTLAWNARPAMPTKGKPVIIDGPGGVRNVYSYSGHKSHYSGMLYRVEQQLPESAGIHKGKPFVSLFLPNKE